MEFHSRLLKNSAFGESGQSGLERETELFAWSSASLGLEWDAPATWAEALNLYIGTFSRV
jgi:hypothetical protein